MAENDNITARPRTVAELLKRGGAEGQPKPRISLAAAVRGEQPSSPSIAMTATDSSPSTGPATPANTESVEAGPASTRNDICALPLDKLLPNQFNTRFGDHRLPCREVVGKGPQVNEAYDPAVYELQLRRYYNEHGPEIKSAMALYSKEPVNLELLRQQHMLIANLGFAILTKGQLSPGEAFFSAAHGSYIVTKGHRRSLALMTLEKGRPFEAQIIEPSAANMIYLHLAGVVGNGEFSPSPSDTLYSMLMAMRAYEDLEGRRPDSHFVLANSPNYSPNMAHIMTSMFNAAQNDQSGYIWEVIQKRAFKSTSHYARIVAGCGSDPVQIAEAIREWQRLESGGEKAATGEAKIALGKKSVASWRKAVIALAKSENVLRLQELAAKGERLSVSEIEDFLNTLIDR